MLTAYISILGCVLCLLVADAQSQGGNFQTVCEPTSKEMEEFRKALELIGKDDPTIDTINPKEILSFSKKVGFFGGFYKVYFTLKNGTVCYISWRTYMKWYRKMSEETCNVSNEKVKEVEEAKEKCKT
uniref:UDP-N-acetylmuramoylalanine--D-glutamate ligase n=1 Tax=Lygus hesperus TaxID=30085 RepID=A0A0A9YE52_LYGHE